MKVIVTGAHGQLGSDVVCALQKSGHTPIPADREEFDITDADQTQAFFLLHRPDAVIHCAAYTAVDKAESEADICRLVNVTGTENVARAAEMFHAKMLYISTDYIYGGQGETPLCESSPASPLNVYGQTKYAGELAAQKCSRLFVVRTSWVFGLGGCNFIKTILRLAKSGGTLRVVCDQVGSPTFTEDLAVLLCAMIGTDKYGTYNATNENFCSWFDFAQTILRKSGQSAKVLPVSSEEYSAPAVRPKNSRLSKQKLSDNGFSRLPSWEDALDRFLARYLVSA
ncbi:MAG: dTDP-4-dehydrorhamnose reductase [Oscillospiraceae bacterium]|nr:dTDP-4-dehydrorhamnose reductase [Oscillospiraceae bacterium]